MVAERRDRKAAINQLLLMSADTFSPNFSFLPLKSKKKMRKGKFENFFLFKLLLGFNNFDQRSFHSDELAEGDLGRVGRVLSDLGFFKVIPGCGRELNSHLQRKKSFLNVLGFEDLDTNVGCLRGHGRVSACVAIGPGFDPRSIQVCFSLTSGVRSQMVVSCSFAWHKNIIYRILVRVVAFRKKDLGCTSALYYCFFLSQGIMLQGKIVNLSTYKST